MIRHRFGRGHVVDARSIALLGQHQGLPTEGEVITAPELPAHYKSAIDYFTYCLLHDEPFRRLLLAGDETAAPAINLFSQLRPGS